MNKKVSPVVGIIIALAVLIGVGLLSTKLFAGNGSDKQTVVKIDNPNDKRFQPDPRLGGGR